MTNYVCMYFQNQSGVFGNLRWMLKLATDCRLCASKTSLIFPEFQDFSISHSLSSQRIIVSNVTLQGATVLFNAYKPSFPNKFQRASIISGSSKDIGTPILSVKLQFVHSFHIEVPSLWRQESTWTGMVKKRTDSLPSFIAQCDSYGPVSFQQACLKTQ